MRSGELINVYLEMRGKALGIPCREIDKTRLFATRAATLAVEGIHKGSGKKKADGRSLTLFAIRPPVIKTLLGNKLLLDKITDHGQFVAFPFISLHHENDPKDHSQRPDNQPHQDPQNRDEPDHRGEDKKREECYKRLERVETYERVLLFKEQKNKPRHPAEHVTKKPFEIFRHAQHCILIFIGHLEPPFLKEIFDGTFYRIPRKKRYRSFWDGIKMTSLHGPRATQAAGLGP